ncbi:MAG: LLM class flavin-dependent oxidoreductase [Gammaproteobacteria bacterium]
MNLGLLFIGGNTTINELTTIATQAEESGFASLCMAEAWRSGWVPLTAMASITSNIQLGTYVLNAYGRSPLLAGMSAIDFNDFCGGRLMLGLGGGNRIINEQWQGIGHERVLTKMREYVTLLQMIARTRLGEKVIYDGKIHRMDWAPSVDPGDEPFPVYLAAVFPKMLKVAAQVADGIAAGTTLSADYLRDVMKPQAAVAAEGVDRDPNSIKWTSVAILAAHDDREYARRMAREAICHLYAPLPHPYYEYTMREQGFGTTVDALLKLMPADDLEGAVAAIPEECIDRLTIAGTPDECRARIASYEGVLDDLLFLNAMPAVGDDIVAAYGPLMEIARGS